MTIEEVAVVEANLFDISGPIAVSYARSSITGHPVLSYRDAEGELSFRGEQLDRVPTPVGELVTVTVRATRAGVVRLVTLLVPAVRLAMGEEVEFGTLLVETVDRSDGVGAALRAPGALQDYRVHQVHGTARAVTS